MRVQDHLTEGTDAEGNVTTYTYSNRDLMTRQDSPVSGVTTRYDEHDKIGNRLTETLGATTDTYSYLPAPGGGRTPILSAVQTPTGTRTYTFGPAVPPPLDSQRCLSQESDHPSPCGYPRAISFSP